MHDEEFDEILETVLRDVRAAGIEILVEPYSTDALHAPAWWASLPGDVGITGIGGWGPLGRQELLRLLADQLQDIIIEQLLRAWPECPFHGDHALAVADIGVAQPDDRAEWSCPSDPILRVPIGDLHLRRPKR